MKTTGFIAAAFALAISNTLTDVIDFAAIRRVLYVELPGAREMKPSTVATAWGDREGFFVNPPFERVTRARPPVKHLNLDVELDGTHGPSIRAGGSLSAHVGSA